MAGLWTGLNIPSNLLVSLPRALIFFVLILCSLEIGLSVLGSRRPLGRMPKWEFRMLRVPWNLMGRVILVRRVWCTRSGDRWLTFRLRFLTNADNRNLNQTLMIGTRDENLSSLLVLIW